RAERETSAEVLAALKSDALTFECWFTQADDEGAQLLFSHDAIDEGELSAADRRRLLGVGVDGGEVILLWQNAGGDVSMATTGALIAEGETYHLGAVRYPATNRNTAKCDVAVYLREKRTGRYFTERFTNVELPDGGDGGELTIGAAHGGGSDYVGAI